MKEKGQQPRVSYPEPLAFFPSPCSSDGQSACLLSLMSLGSNPATGIRLNSATDSVNYPRGLTSGLRQRLGSYAHSHFGPASRRKQGRNGLPQLPYRDGESRILLEEQSAAVQMSAV